MPELFGRVRERARATLGDEVDVELYPITAGDDEIPRNTPIADELVAIHGGAPGFDEDGRLVTPERVLTDAEKPRYPLQIAKGLPFGTANPLDAYRPVPNGQRHVPLEQIILVGDGASDLPAFRILCENAGLPLALSQNDEGGVRKHRDESFGDRRLEHVAPADYTEDGEAPASILLAVDAIASRMALRRLSVDRRDG